MKNAKTIYAWEALLELKLIIWSANKQSRHLRQAEAD
jgi:hypothetical protein